MGKLLPPPDGDSEWARRTRTRLLRQESVWDELGCIAAGGMVILTIGLLAWGLWGG